MENSQNAVRHTSGPWCVGSKLTVGPRSTADDQSFGMVLPLANVYGDNAEADARLIAAVPDLLLAAEEAIRLIEWLHLLGRGDAEIFRHDLRGEAERFEARIAPAIAKARNAA